MNSQDKDLFGNIIIIILLALLIVAGVLSYKSIDWDVLKRLESSTLVLPPPATSSASTTPSADKK